MIKRFSKKQLTTSSILAIAILISIIVTWLAFRTTRPPVDAVFPLGSQLEYVGKSDFGCTGMCDSAPGSTYYYATDMTPEEVVAYFKKAELEYPIEPKLEYTNIPLKNKESSGVIAIYYRENASSFIADRKLKSSSKKHILELDNTSYDVAKQSLE